MDVRDLSGRTVVVTGAGSGIGRESALAFARRGASLAICDVNETGLAETGKAIAELGRDVITQRTDVADAEQMRAFAETVHAQVPAVDLLMNNAGVAIGGGSLDTRIEDWDWIVGINLRGVVLGCHFFVPKMVERGGGGHVVNVASAAGYLASENLAAYSTTKFAVVGFSEALADELRRSRIGVTCICPGIIDTPITRAAKIVGPLAGRPEVRERMVEAYRKRNYGPERVAAAVLKAVQRDRLIAPVTPEAWAFYYLKRFAPWLLRRVTARQTARARREFGLE